MATMKDVARLAGVSTSTVSHVINKDRFVSEAITAKVEAAIKELNYAPSALARSLKLNQTHTIGMLITASTNPFYSELVRGVERSCFERGYSLVLCNTEGDEQRMNRNLETLMQKRVDGLLLLCTETHQPSREITGDFAAQYVIRCNVAHHFTFRCLAVKSDNRDVRLVSHLHSITYCVGVGRVNQQNFGAANG